MTNIELSFAQRCVLPLPCKGLTAEEIGKLISLTDELSDKSAFYQKARKKVIDDNNIVTDEDLNKHENKEEIAKVINDLDSAEVELENANFLTEAKLLKLVEGLDKITVSDIKYLKTFMIEKPVEKPVLEVV